jgi:non-heme chloroperoxidase
MYSAGSLSTPLKGQENYITTADGTQLWTIEAGTGDKTIVLAHGFAFSSIEWNVIMPALVADGYRVIAFDQRGHGQTSIGKTGVSSASMASDYKALLEFYNVQNGILVGHSMGGFLAIKTFLTYPELQHQRIKSCMLMATFAGDVNRHNFQNRLQIPLIKSGILIKLIRNKSIGVAFAKSLMGENPDKEVIRVFLELFLAQKHKTLMPILEAFYKENYYDQLSKITLPCTVVIGSSDKTTPTFHSQDLAQLIPHAQLTVMPNKGHLLNWEAPETLIEEIKKLAYM